MKTEILRPAQQRSGGNYTLRKSIGFNQAAGGGSDHAGAAGLTQTLKIGTLRPGDAIQSGALLHVLTPYGHASTVTASVGITGTVDRFVAASDVKSATNQAYGPTTATHALLWINQSAADVDLIVTFTVGAGNVSAVTAGLILVELPIVRRADRVL